MIEEGAEVLDFSFAVNRTNEIRKAQLDFAGQLTQARDTFQRRRA